MLENYKDSQPIAYKIITNSIKKGRISHAYLIETNEYPKKMDFAISFAKFLLCPKHNVSSKQCESCNICKRIDNGNFTELKIIEPDGLWIKKEQLVELQNEFSKKSIESENKIYIINGAEKLNTASANSILKFLEEPEPGIIAILLTDNIYQLLDTIISRCQIISLHKSPIIDLYDTIDTKSQTLLKIPIQESNNMRELEEILKNEQYQNMIDSAIKFINYYESNHKDILFKTNQLWNSIFNDKEKIMFGFNIMILYYKDLLNMKINRPVQIFEDEQVELEKILNQNTISMICDKIKVLMHMRGKIKYNMNQNLLIDKLIIELEEVRNGKSSKNTI